MSRRKRITGQRRNVYEKVPSGVLGSWDPYQKPEGATEGSFVPRNVRTAQLDENGRLVNPYDWRTEVALTITRKGETDE